jgi:hypothetical protein
MQKQKRNKLAGKHPSYDSLNMSEERRKKKLAYDKKYSATEDRKNYRVKLNKANKSMGKKGDGKDVSHKSNGKLTLESSKSNRSRNGQNGKSTKK